MKKMYRLLLSAVCATMLFSCVKENFEEPQEKPIPDGYEMQEFTATNAETKTSVEINEDGTHGATLWAKGDQLSIFWDGGKGTADLEGNGGSSTGKFKGALPSGIRASHAVYPSSVTASVDGNTVKVTVPAEQNGTFSAGNISVAEVGDENKLAFNNINAFLCVQLVSGDITKITIESVAGEAVVGTIPVTFGENGAECGAVEDGSSKVTMTKNEGETGRYYVSIVPGVTYSEGLLMTYYKGDEVTGTYQLNKQLTPVANKIYNFGEFEPDFNYYVTKDGAGKKTGVTWKDAISISQMVEMVFEDPDNTLTKVLDDKLNGATFHIEEGEYELDTRWRALRFVNEDRVTLSFIGSYDSETHKRDLENSKTSFTGNGNHAILDVDCDEPGCSDMDITFDGIGFVNAKGLTGKNNAAFYSYCGEGKVDLTIKNCFFTGNSHMDASDSKSQGAALLIFSLENVLIENTVFADNEAVRAPAITIADTKATINNCRFEGNSASENAGVVYVDSGAKPTFNECVFTGNSALKWGMLHHQSGTTVLNNCTFTDNSVDDEWDGAAIATRYGSSGSITINGGEFSGNHAGWGAAIYQAKDGKSKVANVYVNDALIKDNTTAGNGAVWSDGVSEFTRCTFDGNTASNNASDYTSAHALLIAKGADMSLYGCTIKNHSSANRIPAILVRGGASLYIGPDAAGKESLVKNNSAANYPAIRLSQKNSEELATLIVESTIFEENNAKYGGAIIATCVSDVTLNDVVFKGNYASSGNGGAILFESSETLKCNRCHFEGNHASGEGGAIKMEGEGDLYCNRCHFENNYAKVGGAIQGHNWSGSISLNACTFKGNYLTKESSGTTIQVSETVTFAMNNCTIADDTYSQTNHASEPRISWISFDKPEKMWLSNNTFIGLPRYNGNPTYGGLVRMWFDINTDAHFVNNIVVNDEYDGVDAFVQMDKSWAQGTRASVTMHHTKYSSLENQDATGEMFTFVESPASSGFSKSSFGGLTWNETECCWKWNGQMSGGNNTSMITKDQFVSALEEACPEFKSWLESNGELLLDQGGRYRGEDTWWPGAYQDGFIPAKDVTVTSFNIRSSNMDKNTQHDWTNRKSGVFAWFNENLHPFVLTQECSEDQRNDVLNNCSAYDAVYYAGTSSWWDQFLGKDTDAPVVTFYKKDDVTVHSSGTFWLVEGAPTSPQKTSTQNQERCATWLKCTYKDKKMVLINAHVSYRTKNGDTGDADDSPMQALREYEMGVIKSWVSNTANYNPSVDGPVVLAGDFNINQGNKMFDPWKDNNDGTGWYYARTTAYNNDKNSSDTGRTFNGWGESEGTIDHQFYSGFSDVASYRIDREPYAGVQYISDHWPVSAVYKF